MTDSHLQAAFSSFFFLMFLFFLFVAALIFLYVMSILWARKDAKARGANEKFAMLVSLIPFAGVLAYVLMRPPLLLIFSNSWRS